MYSAALVSFCAVFAALFPVINPIGDAPIFLNLVQGCSDEVKRKLSRSISINSFFMLAGSMLIGPQLLLFFGVSLPALKLAGGLVVISVGWTLLNQKGSSNKNSGDSVGITDATAGGVAFFPLTMPLTVGPGSIATAISLVAGFIDKEGFHFAEDMPAIIGTTAALIAICTIIHYVYRESSGLLGLLGSNGTNVVTRLFAFILLAIGVQIFLGGVSGYIEHLNQLLPKT